MTSPNASDIRVRSRESWTQDGISKSGKEDAISGVRGFRILLSTDSQGRDLLLIPPGSDGSSTPIKFSTQVKSFAMFIARAFICDHITAAGLWITRLAFIFSFLRTF